MPVVGQVFHEISGFSLYEEGAYVFVICPVTRLAHPRAHT